MLLTKNSKFFKLGTSLKLTTKEVYHYLKQAQDQPPDLDFESLYFQPESNAVYLFYSRFDNDDLYIADGYRWKNGGKHSGTSGVQSQYFYAATSPENDLDSKIAGYTSKFTRCVYTLLEHGLKQGSPVII